MSEQKNYEDAMLDGGERVTYEGGAQREPHKDKGRYDWITPFGLERVAKIGAYLAKRNEEDKRTTEYGPAGPISVASHFINLWRTGDRCYDYLALAAWYVMGAMHMENTGEVMPLGGFISLSPHALERLAKWYEKGGVKYAANGERNWEKGMPYDHPLDSALRHINCWRQGKKEEDNLAAVLWNLFALMHYEECGMDKFDNIPTYPEARERKRVDFPKKTSCRSGGYPWDGAIHVGDKISVYLDGEKIGTTTATDHIVINSTEDIKSFVKELDLAGKTFNDLGKKPAKKRDYKIIVEDFDGTLCKNAWPEIGEPNWDEINYIWWAKKNGAKVILSTCREGKQLDEALAWCESKGLRFDAVNENLPEMIEQFGNNSRKIFGDEYRDDKATKVIFGVRTYNHHELLRWSERVSLGAARRFLNEELTALPDVTGVRGKRAVDLLGESVNTIDRLAQAIKMHIDAEASKEEF